MADQGTEHVKALADIDIRKIEAQSSAKEVASKYIGKTAIPWIVLLVIVGVVSSAFLAPEALPAVIGLVSTAVMAMIAMLSNITGSKEKEEKPELLIIRELINRLDNKPEAMKVNIDSEKVVVENGDKIIQAKR